VEIAHHMELSLYKLCYDVTQFSHRPVGLRGISFGDVTVTLRAFKPLIHPPFTRPQQSSLLSFSPKNLFWEFVIKEMINRRYW